MLRPHHGRVSLLLKYIDLLSHLLTPPHAVIRGNPSLWGLENNSAVLSIMIMLLLPLPFKSENPLLDQRVGGRVSEWVSEERCGESGRGRRKGVRDDQVGNPRGAIGAEGPLPFPSLPPEHCWTLLHYAWSTCPSDTTDTVHLELIHPPPASVSPSSSLSLISCCVSYIAAVIRWWRQRICGGSVSPRVI